MNYVRWDGRGAMTCGFRRKVQIHRLIGSPFAPRIGAIEANMNTSGAGETRMSDADRSHREYFGWVLDAAARYEPARTES